MDNLGTDDIFRGWEEQEKSEVEKEQLDKEAGDRQSSPQVGKNFQEEKWAITNIIEESRKVRIEKRP